MKANHLIITALFTLVATFQIHAQKFSGLDKSPHDISYYRAENSARPIIKILYGRPQLRGRSVGKEIAPYGKVWRTGANEATEIHFYKDVIIGDTLVTAGTYSLLTIPDKKEWTVIINKDIDVWGAYSYNEADDVARIQVPSETNRESLDALSIVFDNDKGHVEMALGWGKTRIFVPISFPEEPKITEEEPSTERTE